MISIEKKQIYMKKMINRKKKRNKAKIIKKFEKTLKLKRAYRRRLSHSSISVQTSIILKNSILSMKKIEVRSFTSSWKNYVYELIKFWSVFENKSELKNEKCEKFYTIDILYRNDEKINFNNIKRRFIKHFLKNLILMSSSITTTRWKDEK
jgi:hypothetical protein